MVFKRLVNRFAVVHLHRHQLPRTMEHEQHPYFSPISNSISWIVLTALYSSESRSKFFFR